MLTVHPGRQADLLTEHRVALSEGVQLRDYHDLFGNVCTRLIAPTGLLEIRNEFVIEDSGLPDLVAPGARQLEIRDPTQWDVGLPYGEPLLRHGKAIQPGVVVVWRPSGWV
jgi:hypothetical protein